jgi:hypothetical protein
MSHKVGHSNYLACIATISPAISTISPIATIDCFLLLFFGWFEAVVTATIPQNEARVKQGKHKIPLTR